MTKWQLFFQIDQSFQIHRSYGSVLEGEADELKVLLVLVPVGDFWLLPLINSVITFISLKVVKVQFYPRELGCICFGAKFQGPNCWFWTNEIIS